MDLHHWLTLYSVPGLGPAAFSALLKRFGTPGAVLEAPRAQLCQVPGIGPEIARSIHQAHDTAWAGEQIARASDAGVRILTLCSADYPAHLRQIYAPPPVLFALGNVSIASGPAIAIVGSRSFTPYGRDTAYRLAGELAGRGITVVSGLATGIDTHAHRGALHGNGPTLAVLGSGLDRPYPPENLGLFRKLCEVGAVLSEFPMGAAPDAHNFPRRNRIISGLSLGVLVVEAGERSGALITARLALEQNREVFAIPGPLYSGRSLGTNRLIRQGAALVQTVDDILAEIRPQLGGALPAAQPPQGPDPRDELPEEDRPIFDCLSPDQPLHVDTIAARVGLPAARTLTILLTLELSGLAEERPGKRFVRKMV